MTTDPAPDYEPTNDAAFSGQAADQLGDATELATNALASEEGQPETPDNEGANTSDETPDPDPARPIPEPEPAPEPEPQPVPPGA